MGSLSNLYISQSYTSLIHLGNDSTITGLPVELQDGLGNGTGIYLNSFGDLTIDGDFQADLANGYIWVGDSSGRTTQVATSSFNAASIAALNSFTASANQRLTSLETNSASVNVSISNLNQFTASLDATYVTDTEFRQYTSSTNSRLNNIESTTASLNVSVSNLNASSASQQISINSLNSATASYANSASVAAVDAAQQQSINSLNAVTSSFLTASTDISQLNQFTASQLSINSGYNSFTSSQQSFNSSATASISQLLSFSSSLDANFVTEAELAAATGSLINQINTKLNTSSFNSYTASQSTASLVTSIDNLNTFSASTLVSLTNLNSTTESLNSSVSNLNTNSASVNTSITNINNTTASLNTSVSNLNSATASLFTSASLGLTTASFSGNTLTFTKGNGSTFGIVIPDISGSAGDFVTTASFNDYTSSNNQRVSSLESNSASVNTSITNLNSATSSLFGSASLGLVTASVVTNVITFKKGDGSTFDLTVSASGSAPEGTISSSAQITALGFVSSSVTASSLVTASFSGNTLTFTKGDASTFGVVIPDVSGSAGTTIFEVVYTGENITKGDPLYISGSQGANPKVFKADAADPNKMPVTFVSNETIAVNNTTNAIVLGLIEGIDLTGYTAGQTIYVAEGGGWSANLPSGSNSVTQLLGVVTKGGNGGKGLVLNPGPAQLPGLDSGKLWVGGATNQPTEITTASFASSASFNSFTSSANQRLTAIESVSGSWITESETGSFATTGSNSFTGTQTLGLGAIVPNGQDIVFSMLTGSIAMRNNVGLNRLLFLDPISNQKYLYIDKDTAEVFVSGAFSAQLQNGYAWVGDSTGRSTQVATSSFGTSINTGSFATTGSNVFTGDQTIFKSEGKLLFQSGASATAHVKQTIDGNLELAVQNNQKVLVAPSLITLQTPTTINGATTINGDVYALGANRNFYAAANSSLAGTNYPGFTAVVSTATTPTDIFGGFNINNSAGATLGAFVVNSYTAQYPNTPVPTIVAAGNNPAGSDTAIAFPSDGRMDVWKNTNFAYDVNITGSLTASLQQGYVWVGNGSGKTTTVATSSFATNISNLATTGSNTFIGNQTISGSLRVTGSVIGSKVGAFDFDTLFLGSQLGGTTANGTFFGYGSTDYSFIVGAYAGGFDNELQTYVDSTGIYLKDFNGSGYNTFLKLNPNPGTNPKPIFTRGLEVTGSTNIAELTASLQQGYVWVGNASGRTTTVATSSFVSTINTGSFATTGSNAFFGNNSFSGTFAVSASAISILSGSSSGSVITNLTDTYTTIPEVNQIVTLPSASYAALFSGSLTNPNTLYIVSGSLSTNLNSLNAFTASQLVLNTTFATTGSFTASLQQGYAWVGGVGNISNAVPTSSFGGGGGFPYVGNAQISGSLGVTGSVSGFVNSLSISSNTASMDFNNGNFFTLQLVSGSITHLTATNIKPGQTINLLVKTDSGSAAASGSLTFSPTFKFAGGFDYTPTAITASQDLVSFVTFDTTQIFAGQIKNLS